MSAQGIQPQSGSGAGEYDDWANFPQYSPEDWDELPDMHDSSEYDEDLPEGWDDHDCYYQKAFDDPNSGQRAFATRHILGSDLKPNEKFNHKTAPSFDGSMSWLLFCEVVKVREEVIVVDKSQRGHHLRNRLSGSAALSKRGV